MRLGVALTLSYPPSGVYEVHDGGEERFDKDGMIWWGTGGKRLGDRSLVRESVRVTISSDQATPLSPAPAQCTTASAVHRMRSAGGWCG